MKWLVVGAAVVGALTFGVAPAPGQHVGDILLTVPGGRIDTGRIALDGGLTTGLRVFEAPFSSITPGFTDSPGYDDAPGTFATPSSIGFRLRGGLRKWMNGNFDLIPVERVAVTFGPLGPVSTPTTDSVVTGFSLNVGSNGQWHRHLEYTLSPPQREGVYLMGMSLFSSRAEVGESRPYWMVFGMNAAQGEMDAAAEWVRAHLACAADFNGDGAVSVQDIFDFLAAYFTGSSAGDFNGVGGVTVQDVFDFLAAYFGGCG